MKKEQFMVVVVVGFILIYTVIYGGAQTMESNWIKSYRNVEKASGIVKYLIENYTFASSSISNPNSPPVGTDFGRYPTLIIYTIVDRKEQNRILEITKKYMSNNNVKIATVKFYDKENWIVEKDSSGNVVGGMRGPENLIREVMLKRDKGVTYKIEDSVKKIEGSDLDTKH